jgi:hypothetical protein
MVRIWPEDALHMTFYELQEWLEAMFHAGVTHVFVYDNYERASEAQLRNLAPYIAAGLVTYHAWPIKRAYGYPFSQLGAYTHCLYRYGRAAEGAAMQWLFQADIDEYPLLHSDASPGYLLRFVQGVIEQKPHISQIRFHSVFFGGRETTTATGPARECPEEGCDVRCTRPLLIERHRHREDEPDYTLRAKPVYLVSKMWAAEVHTARGVGTSVEVRLEDGWLAHYWGHRCKTCHTYDLTVQPLAPHIRSRLRARTCG